MLLYDLLLSDKIPHPGSSSRLFTSFLIFLLAQVFFFCEAFLIKLFLKGFKEKVL